MAQEIGAIGLDVVLDCGFSRRSHRDEARDRLTRAGLPVELVYFDVPPEERWRRLEARNHALPADCYHVTRATFDALDASYEPPGPNEPVRIVASR